MKELVGSGYLYVALCVLCSCILIAGFLAWAFCFVKHIVRHKETNLQRMYGQKKEHSEKEKKVVFRLVLGGFFLGIYAVLYFIFI